MINFTHIFQDCWNFMRNQQKITLQFTALFFVTSIFTVFFTQPSQIQALELSETMPASSMDNLQISKYLIMLGLLQVLLKIFISAWGTATIHQLSQHFQAQLSHSFTIAAKRLLGLVLINILISIPLGIGASEILVSTMTHKSPSVFSLIAVALGIFVFVRLNLLNVHYLIHNQSFNQSLRTMWQSGIKRTQHLFLYTLISYIALPLLLRQFSLWVGNNLLMEILITAIISLADVFLLIFTYRFYTIFMQQKEQ
ncbi:hypothetical protein B0186_05825 [Canicola haemoglobinophilus]|uniref:Intracellular septation protein A n=2 Tax=Canicola haemoglobinophilus TaxID=733 RepID=A0A1V4B1B5_9PAST|nr:hypothetical protein B0186_05825 [Canicola haemoglobinophilus]STO60223.1 intracellular septation protein A [Canicola haemoglobinophilus]